MNAHARVRGREGGPAGETAGTVIGGMNEGARERKRGAAGKREREEEEEDGKEGEGKRGGG